MQKFGLLIHSDGFDSGSIVEIFLTLTRVDDAHAFAAHLFRRAPIILWLDG